MAIVLDRISQKSLSASVAKARSRKPHVKPIGIDLFEVKGSTGAYTVRFLDSCGGTSATCSCPATALCYHITACFPLRAMSASIAQATSRPVCTVGQSVVASRPALPILSDADLDRLNEELFG